MFQFSEIKSVDLNKLPGKRGQSREFTQKLLALDVGQGFEVSGMKRNNVASRSSLVGKMHARSFGVTGLEGGVFLVFRKS